MASTKSLFFLGFALSAAVLAVSSSPVVEVNRPDLPVENFGKVHNFGQRESGDYMAKSMSFTEVHNAGHVMEFFKYIIVAPHQVITQVSVIDQSGRDDTSVFLAFGGSGFNGVVLRCIAENGNMNIAVKIYAKNIE